jgi:hypothetical protein
MPIVLLPAATLVAFAGATPATAAAPLALRLTSATVLTRGAAADLRYTASCSPATAFTVTVTLAQRTGTRVATATGEARGTCTGRAQTVLLHAVPETPGATFRPGSAVATSALRVLTGPAAQIRRTAKPRLVAGSPDQKLAGQPAVRVSRATLRDAGPVTVDLLVTCPAGRSGRQNAGLYQGNRGRVASGWGSVELTCTGSPQKVLVTVERDVTGEPFTLGPAMVDARAWGCAGGDCFAVRPWIVFPVTR